MKHWAAASVPVFVAAVMVTMPCTAREGTQSVWKKLPDMAVPRWEAGTVVFENQLSRITRREFIGTAAAATAFTIVPRHILGHNIYEIRLATQLAEQYGVITQMGIGNHTTEIFHQAVEIIQAGDIGQVRDVYVWCDNEWDPYET